MYTARAIEVFHADDMTQVAIASFGPDGTYRVSLPPGTYLVRYVPHGADGAEGLPRTVTIQSNATTRLDIRIDTGIR